MALEAGLGACKEAEPCDGLRAGLLVCAAGLLGRPGMMPPPQQPPLQQQQQQAPGLPQQQQAPGPRAMTPPGGSLPFQVYCVPFY